MGLLDFIFRKKDKWMKQTHEKEIQACEIPDWVRKKTSVDMYNLFSNKGEDNNNWYDPMLVKPKVPESNPHISGGAAANPKDAVIDLIDIKKS